jgi:PadR family transcriptional regulator PadR
MDAQFKKGILEMCILYSIYKEEMYGYDIMQKMSNLFPEVNESTFYSILRRLCGEGATEVYYGTTSNGPKRKYYRITSEGKKYLDTCINDWTKIKRIVSEIGIPSIARQDC